jgi:predicted O-methyltransferase YrrM
MVQTINTIIKVFKEEGISSLFAKSYLYLKQLIVLPYYIIKNKNELSVKDSVDVSFNSATGILKPAQIQGEISYVMEKIKDIHPLRVMELGTGKGGNLFLLCNATASNGKIISLDLRGGAHGAGYPPWRVPLFKSFVSKDKELILLLADSHKIETKEQIGKILGNEKLDVLFIDGDHSYAGVKRDFELYNSFVRSGGLIIFHDIAICKTDPTCQVDMFWNELKNNYEYEEVIEDRNQGWGGLGIMVQHG